MGINYFLTLVLPFVHIILGLSIAVFLLIVFPKNVRDMDPEWLVNNIKTILLNSFGMGGFVSISIGLLWVAINGDWPSNYIPTSSVSTSIFITVIYLSTHIWNDIKSFKMEIERKYGLVAESR